MLRIRINVSAAECIGNNVAPLLIYELEVCAFNTAISMARWFV